MNREKRQFISDKVRTRSERALVWILTEAQKQFGTVTAEKLAEVIYPQLTQKHRAVRHDLELLSRPEQIPLIRTLFDQKLIIALPFILQDTQFLEDLSKHDREKWAIAQYIVRHNLGYNQSIFLDTGTTIFFIALAITQSIYRDLPIVTNNLSILPLVASKVPLKVISGSVKRDRAKIVSNSPAYNIAEERIHQSFISVTGISYDYGVFCEEELIEDKCRVVRGVREAITLVADHSKIGVRRRTGPFITIEELIALKSKDTGPLTVSIVTDDNSQCCSVTGCLHAGQKKGFAQEVQKLREAGIQVEIVPVV